MGKRNTYGTGSLFYNKSKKRWVVAIAQPSTLDGKRRRLQRSFRTKQEAFAYFNEVQHGIGDGRTLLVTDLLDNWLQARQRRVDSGDLAPKTMELSVLAARHVRASLGTIVATELSVDAVEVFLSDQLEQFSSRYVQLQRNVLDQVYKWAMRNRLLSWNPVTLSVLPRSSNNFHGTVLTVEQVSKLLDVSKGGRWHALWAVMVGVGLRPGEAMGLTWNDVDDSVIHVRQFLRLGVNGPYLGVPKTARSARSLDAPAFTIKALTEHRAMGLVGVGDWEGLVFASGSGGPLDLHNARRALRSCCRDAGLPRITLYDLRRTAGRLLVDAGVHLEQVADLLGHSTVATTRRHYVRALRPTVPHATQLDTLMG